MKDVHYRRAPRHRFDRPPAPDLFDWAARRDATRLTTAGTWLYRHRRIPPSRANLIAELAGLGEVSR